METTPVSEITSGADLFFCEPYNCKLLARACVERQARFAAGVDKTGLRMCGGCALGKQVQERSGVVIDPASLVVVRGRVRSPVPRAPAPTVKHEVLAPIHEPTVQETPQNPEPPRAPIAAASAHPKPAKNPDAAKVRWCAPGSDFAHTIVSKKPELSPPHIIAPALPDVCDHGIALGIHCKRCQLTEPLTREMLERAMVVYGLYWGTDRPDDAIADEWVEFFNEHGAELIALSMAALGRISPPAIERRGKYQKHKLGATQQRIVDLLGDGKRHTVTDISRELGHNYQNTRRMLPVLERRGLIRNEFDQLREATVWVRSGAGSAADIAPPSCEVGVAEGESPCGNLADHRIRLGKDYMYSCASCAQGYTDVGAFEDGEDAALINL